jgi:hypothetical protein
MRRRARTPGGTYTAHNTPGDGTGFSRLPELDDPGDILTDVDPKARDAEQDPHGPDVLQGVWSHKGKS